MTTTTQQTGNGSPRTATDSLRVAAPGRQRRPRVSWIALGLLVLVAFGLAGAITVARVAGREPVLALTQSIERGEELTAEDLTVVDVGTDGNVPVVPSTGLDDLVGLTATARLEAGTLVSRGLFADGPTVAAGESILGLALAPGEYPTSTLRPGDLVAVVRTPETTAGSQPAPGPDVIADRAEVFAVEILSETARTMMVSIVVPEEAASDVAAAAAASRIRLALVASR